MKTLVEVPAPQLDSGGVSTASYCPRTESHSDSTTSETVLLSYVHRGPTAYTGMKEPCTQDRVHVECVLCRMYCTNMYIYIGREMQSVDFTCMWQVRFYQVLWIMYSICHVRNGTDGAYIHTSYWTVINESSINSLHLQHGFSTTDNQYCSYYYTQNLHCISFIDEWAKTTISPNSYMLSVYQSG